MKKTWSRTSTRTPALLSQALEWWHNLPSLRGQHGCLQEGELRVISSLHASSTPCSNRAGRKHSNLEEWRKNNKDWDPRFELIVGCIEHNSELIRTLAFDMEDLKKLVEDLIKRTPPPPKG